MATDAAGVTLPSSAIPPLHWWRCLPATAFEIAHVAVLKRAISGIGLIREPLWPAAANGDAAAAVGVALRAITRHRKPTPTLDLIMSALLRCALEGSSAAGVTLWYALDRLTAAEPAYAPVAASWQVVLGRADRGAQGA